MFEYGFPETLQTRTDDAYLLQAQKNLPIYESLEAFVKDISRKFSPNVKLYNIQNLFTYFGCFLAFVLFGFVANIFVLKQLKTSKRKLVCCLKKYRRDRFWRRIFHPKCSRFKIGKLRIRLKVAKWTVKRLLIKCKSTGQISKRLKLTLCS